MSGTLRSRHLRAVPATHVAAAVVDVAALLGPPFGPHKGTHPVTPAVMGLEGRRFYGVFNEGGEARLLTRWEPYSIAPLASTLNSLRQTTVG